MNDLEAFREFTKRIGRPEEPYRDGFRETWRQLALLENPHRPRDQPAHESRAIDLLVGWYQDERKGDPTTSGLTNSPLHVIENFRHPRAWVIFLCWSHHGQPFSPR